MGKMAFFRQILGKKAIFIKVPLFGTHGHVGPVPSASKTIYNVQIRHIKSLGTGLDVPGGASVLEQDLQTATFMKIADFLTPFHKSGCLEALLQDQGVPYATGFFFFS